VVADFPKSNPSKLGAIKLAFGLLALVLAHAIYVFLVYRDRVLTHSALSSSDFVLLYLPMLLAFGGYAWLLRARGMHPVLVFIFALILTSFSFWASMLVPMNVYGT
jgi:hypothetical protein